VIFEAHLFQGVLVITALSSKNFVDLIDDHFIGAALVGGRDPQKTTGGAGSRKYSHIPPLPVQ
jgi:hypothetical protein